MFVSRPLSEYISVKGNEIVLSNCVMLNVQNELILNNSELVMEELTKPKVDDIVSQCNTYIYLKNNGGDLGDSYSRKAIYIIPNSDFIDKIYVSASTEICEALYRHYEKNTKDMIVKII
ncbi:6021_t:CDS:2 [Dentiscutata erythropus]|uniref:6021_t:CDS:1 n=1 Tax=Dentiscutata erythropus TaxID=1348616 RepID=A0A9N9BZG1_9GLOM|nr:6021_t:CDS:2 [Dentiscutata erythropus]